MDIEGVLNADAKEKVALENYTMLLGCDRKAFRKLTVPQRREKIQELISIAREEIVEKGERNIQVRGLRKWENVTNIDTGEAICTHTLPEFTNKLDGRYTTLLNKYRKRGIDIGLEYTDEYDWYDVGENGKKIWHHVPESWGFGMHIVELSNEYEQIKDMRAAQNEWETEKKTLQEKLDNPVPKVKGDTRKLKYSTQKAKLERITEIDETLTESRKLEKHIMHTRFDRALPYFMVMYNCGGLGYGMGNYIDRNKGVKTKIREIEDFVEVTVTPEVFDEKYKAWKIAPDFIHEMKEAIGGIQYKHRSEVNKAIHAKKLVAWDNKLIRLGYNPMKYNNLTPMEDIKAGTAVKRSVGRPKTGKKRKEQDERERERAIAAIKDESHNKLLEYRKTLPKTKVEQHDRNGDTFTVKVLTEASEKLSAAKEKQLAKELKRELHIKHLVKDEGIKQDIAATKKIETIKKKILRKIVTFGNMYDMRVNDPNYNFTTKKPRYSFLLMKGWLLQKDEDSVKVQSNGEEVINQLLALKKQISEKETFTSLMRWIQRECKIDRDHYEKVVRPTWIAEEVLN